MYQLPRSLTTPLATTARTNKPARKQSQTTIPKQNAEQPTIYTLLLHANQPIITKMPTHEFYADGSPRPLLRGWLHGIAVIITLPMVLYTHITSAIPAPALPGVLAICATLFFSSLVHLVPWKSKTLLEGLVRLDKSGILAICGTSFWGPQLLDSHGCKPSYQVALVTIAIPVSLAALGIWCGCGPIVFVGCAVAAGQSFYFYATHVEDTTFLYYSLVCCTLYACGLALYVLQLGGHRRYWGYHEWMHLLVTLAFIVNARGLWLMSAYTNETCQGSNGSGDYTTNASIMGEMMAGESEL